MFFKTTLENEQATDAFGAWLAFVLKDALFNKAQSDPHKTSYLVFLKGELGAGKTSLVRACLRALGIEGAIKSPTYTLLEPYEVLVKMQSESDKDIYIESLKIAHLDLYRLQEPEELDYIGGRDLSSQFNVVFIEWPEKGQGAMPGSDINIQLNHIDTGRELIVSADNVNVLNKLKSFKNN